MEGSKKIEVVFFQRKPRTNSNFSLESYFDTVRDNLSKEIISKKHVVKYQSNGVLKRILIAWEVFFNQGQINHLTGDINFANLFLPKKKTVLTVLDCGFLENKSSIERFILKLFWLQIPIKKSKLVTAISEATKTEILKNVRCDSDKIKVIYVPVNKMFKLYNGKDFNKNKPIILQVGTKKNKNLTRLIKALEDVPCVLDIVGELRPDHIVLLEKTGVEYTNSIRISDNELLNKYKQCDMLSFVSTYEGFGMPIVEANIVGKPVITGNVYSMPEIAGNAACLVDPFNISEIKHGIQRIIDDDQYRNTLIENGRKNKDRFLIENICKKYVELYREVVDSK